MSATAIEWTDVTWNPVTGCDRTSPGCDHCYALTLAKRLKAMGNPRYQVDGDPRSSGPGFGVTLHPDKLTDPLHWRTPRRVFVNSMSDLFHQDVPKDFIADAFAVMAIARAHTFQILTKRPQRAAKLLRDLRFHDSVRRRRNNLVPDRPQWEVGHWPMRHVWVGTSIESDAYTFRANHLRTTGAGVKFLSLEPLLGPLPSLDLTDIDWVIVGGESGPGARPMHPDWVRDIRDRCIAEDVPFFFKQWGAWAPLKQLPYETSPKDSTPRGTVLGKDVFRVGKKAAGRAIDGRFWNEFPA